MNKTIFRKLMAVTLVLAMVLACGTVAFADTSAAPAPGVMIDGESVAFTDAVPKNVNGRVMVPFTAIFEAMGATVTYDKATKTVSAVQGDTQISFVAGQKDIKVTEGDVVSTKTMDVAPFIDANTSRTYVPTRFVAEALGYAVGWDKAEKTVVIIDFEKLFANVEADFSIVSKLADPEASTASMEQAYKTSGELVYDLTMYGQSLPTEKDMTKDMTMSLDGKYTGMQKGMDANLDFVVKIDMADFMEQMGDAANQAELAELMKSIENIQMKVKLNGETGDFYLQSELFNKLTGVNGTNVWYSLNLYDMYEEMGIDLKGMMNSAMTGDLNVTEMLVDMISQSQALTVDTYASAQSGYEIAKALIGDSAFTTSKSGSTTTYTAKINNDTLSKALAGDTGEAGAAEVKKLLEGVAIEGNVVIKERNDALLDYSITAKATTNEIKVDCGMTGDSKNAKMTMTLDLPTLMKLTMGVSSNVTETSGAVDVTVPATDTVIDLMEELKLPMPAAIPEPAPAK